MRTTLDLPDPIFRDLKSRAAQQGMKLKELVQKYVEDGLRGADGSKTMAAQKWELPKIDGGGDFLIPLEQLKDLMSDEETTRSIRHDLV
jgi:hypothetical protein